MIQLFPRFFERDTEVYLEDVFHLSSIAEFCCVFQAVGLAFNIDAASLG